MDKQANQVRLSSIERFRTARLHANLEQLQAVLFGRSATLLSYDEVREKVQARETGRRELKSIPLDGIVGSVGRYNDFTRRFFPLVDKDEYRWARVYALTEGLEGVPPIEVFQLGDVYFVRDGNHRVSVARELGATTIEAYVTLVEAPVPLEPDLQPEDLILKEQQARFLEETGLHETAENADFSMTAAGNYRVLIRRIEIHQAWLERETGREVTFSEAALDWYRTIYRPAVQIIRQRGILRDFPDRTETDLYVWLEQHREELAANLGWSVPAEAAADDLVAVYSQQPDQVLQRAGEAVRSAFTPELLDAGPAPGAWRESWLTARQDGRLFSHVLVAINGREDGWLALEQGLAVARREHGRVFGLHVTAALDEEEVLALKETFDRRCTAAGVTGELSVESGDVTDLICARARWSDLVVLSLAHPPGPQPAARLGSRFSALLRRCPRPVLAVPRVAADPERLLLAFDGSPKAREGLFVAAYLAGNWEATLTVLTVEEKVKAIDISAEARQYLAAEGVEAEFVVEKGEVAAGILQAARERNCDLIIMGGYGYSPLLEIVMGSTVDELLRARSRPVLICR